VLQDIFEQRQNNSETAYQGKKAKSPLNIFCFNLDERKFTAPTLSQVAAWQNRPAYDCMEARSYSILEVNRWRQTCMERLLNSSLKQSFKFSIVQDDPLVIGMGVCTVDGYSRIGIK
jgi:hypothetical protein